MVHGGGELKVGVRVSLGLPKNTRGEREPLLSPCHSFLSNPFVKERLHSPQRKVEDRKSGLMSSLERRESTKTMYSPPTSAHLDNLDAKRQGPDMAWLQRGEQACQETHSGFRPSLLSCLHPRELKPGWVRRGSASTEGHTASGTRTSVLIRSELLSLDACGQTPAGQDVAF